MISDRLKEKFKQISDCPLRTYNRELEKALCAVVEAAEWIAGRDETKPYCTYFERTLEDGTAVPTNYEIAEQALQELELRLKECGI